MQTLIYLHGFLSAPGSTKARQTADWLQAQHSGIQYLCPHLSPYPNETQQQLDALMQPLLAQGDTVSVIGSSLGGFWATYLVETYGVRAVLINPSVRPYDLVESLLGQTLQNYYTDDRYQMLPEHAQQLRRIDFPEPQRPDCYWLLAQKGDETLDYRQAEKKYQRCKMLIEEAGDHAFQGYEEKLPAIVDFLYPLNANP